MLFVLDKGGTWPVIFMCMNMDCFVWISIHLLVLWHSDRKGWELGGMWTHDLQFNLQCSLNATAVEDDILLSAVLTRNIIFVYSKVAQLQVQSSAQEDRNDKKKQQYPFSTPSPYTFHKGWNPSVQKHAHSAHEAIVEAIYCWLTIYRFCSKNNLSL